MVDGDAIFRCHVDEHAPKPIVGDRRYEVGRDAKLGAAKGRGHRIAAKRHGIAPCDGLFVAGRNLVGEKGQIDIRLPDEKCSHAFSDAWRPQFKRARIAPMGSPVHRQKIAPKCLFFSRQRVGIELGV